MACGMVPEPIIRRKKQPYRSPDALCFVRSDAPEYVAQLLSREAVRDAGVFDPDRVRRLYEKCLQQGRSKATEGLFSNLDNMAFVGILSTQLLHHQFITHRTDEGDEVKFTTLVDRIRSSETITK